jgi:DNA modification methylase
LNKIKFINGDCILEMDKLIKSGIKINKIVTSPPYNIIRPNSTDRGYDVYKDGMSNEEYIRWTLKIFNKFDKLIEKDGCILYNMSYGGENTTCMNLTIAEIIKETDFTLADIIVWKKKSATPNNVSKNKLTRIVEFIYVFVKKSDFKSFETNKKIVGVRKTGQKTYENKFNFVEAKNNDKSTDINKATYSTDLMNKLFDFYVKEDDVILDPFGGTGTTACASFLRGNKCYSIELSEKQVEYSKERLIKLNNNIN